MSIDGSNFLATQNIENANSGQDQYESLDTRVTELNVRVTQNETDIGNNSEDIVVHGFRLDGQDAVIGSLNTRMGTAEGNISTNTSNIATNTSNISTNASDIALTHGIALDNQGAISSHEFRLNDNDISIDSNTNNVASILQRITDIQYYASNDSTFINNRVTIRSSIDSATSATPQITLWNTSSQAPNQVIYSIMAGVENGAWNSLAREGDCLMLTRNQTGVPGSYTGGMIFTTHGGSSGFRFSYDPAVASVFRSDVDMTSHDLTTTGNISTGTMNSTGTISAVDITSSGNITSSGTISALDISTGTINLAGNDLDTRISAIESDISGITQIQHGTFITASGTPTLTDYVVLEPNSYASPPIATVSSTGFTFTSSGIYRIQLAWQHSGSLTADTDIKVMISNVADATTYTSFPTFENMYAHTFFGNTNGGSDWTSGANNQNLIEMFNNSAEYRYAYTIKEKSGSARYNRWFSDITANITAGDFFCVKVLSNGVWTVSNATYLITRIE